MEKLIELLDLLEISSFIMDYNLVILSVNDTLLKQFQLDQNDPKKYLKKNFNKYFGDINQIKNFISGTDSKKVYELKMKQDNLLFLRKIYFWKLNGHVCVIINQKYDILRNKIREVCHDVRNPLSTITGLTQISLAGMDNEEVKENLELSLKYIDKILDIMDDLYKNQ